MRPMSKPAAWSQTVTVSGISERLFNLYCEPEGAVHEVAPGDVLTVTFSAPHAHDFELSWVPEGLILSRLGDSDVAIEDKRGRELLW